MFVQRHSNSPRCHLPLSAFIAGVWAGADCLHSSSTSSSSKKKKDFSELTLIEWSRLMREICVRFNFNAVSLISLVCEARMC